jgi:hypothetical protein
VTFTLLAESSAFFYIHPSHPTQADVVAFRFEPAAASGLKPHQALSLL